MIDLERVAALLDENVDFPKAKVEEVDLGELDFVIPPVRVPSTVGLECLESDVDIEKYNELNSVLGSIDGKLKALKDYTDRCHLVDKQVQSIPQSELAVCKT
eukprot:NODE_459_length_8196_cov_0.388539.p7 type:complete len:102 gc:universal NODE_459_length_8196_cov_0.388539:5218-5523(+)